MQVTALLRDTAFIDRLVAGLAGFSLIAVYLLSSQSGASFATYLLALLVLAGGRARWQPVAARGWIAPLLLVFLAYFCASAAWSDDVSPRGAWSVCSRSVLIATFVIAFATSLQRVPDFGTWLARAIAMSGALAATGALLDLHFHPTWDGRLVGLGQLHNSVVAALTFDASLLCALYVAVEQRGAWRCIGAICAVVLAAAVVETGSRDGYLSALIGGSVLLALARPAASGGRWRWVAAALLALLAGAAAFALVPPDWQQVLMPRGGSFRAEIWAAEWQRLVDGGPWFGLGVLTPEPVTVGSTTFAHAHSLYLATALQGGVVGLLLLLAVLGGAAWRLLRSHQRSEVRLAAALLAAGASGYAFDGWELIDKVSSSWLLIWVPVATALATETIPPMRNA